MPKEKTRGQQLLPGAEKELKRRKISVRGHWSQGKKRYTKQDFLRYNDGFDFLQNLYVVRSYIMDKYDMSLPVFEMVLYLAPFAFFTQKDYNDIMARDRSHYRLKGMVKSGMIEPILKGDDKRGPKLYTLSRTYRGINVMVYKLLSGEKKIPDTYLASFAKRELPAGKKSILDLINKINDLPVPETKRRFFE